ncbi:hypothetical protein GIB67_040708 [Kingdonia uniflora]|uniref:ATP-dependent RNA helicase n=1 Tax=Kingdonia uniflora TaxID=39325 RepID=A0A7J7KUE9_9MAGN|nr:hypothetical protein GIB67_040708 [Kingdonia uniflora]
MYLHRNRSATLTKLLCNISFTRTMGGGPRTFPGGLNKWQWKRMHEKKAQEKERKLLDQEKQLYQARIRSQIRSKLDEHHQPMSNKEFRSGFAPLTANDHVKGLADRFMEEGAEDLWNEDDGSIKSTPLQTPSIGLRDRALESPVGLRKLIPNGGNRVGVKPEFGSLRPRYYSALAGRRPGREPMQKFRYRRNESSSSDSDDDGGEFEAISEERYKKPYGNENRGVRGKGGRSSFEEEESDREMGLRDRMGSPKKMMSRATLGDYDKKKERRAPKAFEDSDLSGEIELIRDELRKRSSSRDEVRRDEGETLFSQKRFDECNISPLTIKALTSAGYVRMTRVQEATLRTCLHGMDVLVKAKTGTGKSAAFLLPAIEAVIKATTSSVNQRVPPILVLILCPTRELASQIAAEANVMIKHHDGIGVQTLTGGTRFKDDQRRLESQPSQIIVATPGRLLDHIENKSGFSVRLMGLKMLILDEADHLLDLGFRKDMEEIVDCVPRQRQSLLFSATIRKEVRRISQLFLKRDHVFIDTVGFGALETHAKVKQSYVVAPHEQHFLIVHQLLKEHISQVVDYKVVMVFCTTAMMTSLMFHLLREMQMNTREMHSRKPQMYRTRISDEFRESKRLILVTSDVSARGMDYPDVTLVIQVGIPTDREHYIHRLGRTGREGKNGEGILLIAPWEEYFIDEIKDLPIKRSPAMNLDSNVKLKVDDAMLKIDNNVKEAAYHAWLGHYNSIREIGRDKTTLVELAKRFCDSIGLQKPPSLFKKTAVKMGLKNIPGIQIRK